MAARSAPVESCNSVVLTNLLQVDDVDGPIAGTELGETVGHRSRGRFGRGFRSLGQGQTPGEPRADGGRMSAARSVRGRDGVPLDRYVHVIHAVEEVVDGLAVPAGDNHRLSPEGMDPLRELGLSNSLLLGKNG